MKHKKDIIYSSYYPLRRIQEDEEMLTKEFERVKKSNIYSKEDESTIQALKVIKSRLSQLEEVKELILSLGVNEC